jgi:hypothetical protein
MLGCFRPGVLLHLQCRERERERLSRRGQRNFTALGQTVTGPGTVDASASANGQFLYVQTGANGVVDEFEVDTDGTLAPIGSVTVAGAAGGEGIVAF